MRDSPPLEPTRERRTWIAAWVISLLLHVVALAGFPRLPAPRAPMAVRDTIPIQLLGDDPQVFTELPADRADEAPKASDFLSNVTSRARDRAPGGDQSQPRLSGNADAPAVGLADRNGGSANGARSSVLARPGFAASRLVGPGIASAEPAPPGAAARPPGGARTAQAEAANPGGNVALSGDVSLSTTAWNYAPWLERFRERLMSRWYAPPAYYYGILKEGGFGMFEVEISRGGKMLRFQELAEDGHPSLAAAAKSALRNVAPIEALPADFPDSTLVLRIRMTYPEIRRP
jgi:hypothetical protein